MGHGRFRAGCNSSVHSTSPGRPLRTADASGLSEVIDGAVSERSRSFVTDSFRGTSPGVLPAGEQATSEGKSSSSRPSSRGGPLAEVRFAVTIADYLHSSASKSNDRNFSVLQFSRTAG